MDDDESLNGVEEQKYEMLAQLKENKGAETTRAPRKSLLELDTEKLTFSKHAQ
jgi:hypothetical protein